MNIYLIRHGQSSNNAGQSHVPDAPLTDLGREQARLAARALASRNLGAVALYASPMRRALQTAGEIGHALNLPLHILPDLCESGGLRESAGLGRAAILNDFPTAILDDRIGASGWWVPNPDEEPETSVYARAARSLATLRERHLAAGDTILVVTHGTFGSALLSTAVGLGPCGYVRYVFENTGISRLLFETAQASLPADIIRVEAHETAPHTPAILRIRLRVHNDLAHLPADHIT